MMSLKKVFSIVVGVVILIQLCNSNEINTEKNYSNDAMDQPSDVESVNVSDEKANLTESTTMTSKFKSDIKIDDQKYTQNTSGEYKHQILFNNGNWHAEHGEYENHDGTVVFVVRGAFSYHTKEGTYKTTFYVVDEFGYHVIEPPPEIPIIQDGGGQVDYRPDVGTSTECGDSKENYCIDPKLLALLVG